MAEWHTFDQNAKVALRRANERGGQTRNTERDRVMLTISSSQFCFMSLTLAVLLKKSSTKEILPTASASRS